MADRLTLPELVGRLPVPSDAPFSQALKRRLNETIVAPALREFWKYTPIQEFVSGLENVPVTRPELIGADRPGVAMTSLAGGSYPLGPGDEPSAGRFPLADLALLLTGDLLVVRVSQSQDAPIALNFPDGLHVPVLVTVDAGVEVCLVEQATAGAFANHSLYLDVGAGAVVEHASTALITTASHWSLTQVRQAEGSRYRRQQYQLGARRRRSETQVLLAGSEARAEITGAFVVDGGAHLDQQLVVEHRGSDTVSRQQFHGIGAGKGTAVFNGRIHIHPGAPRSDAELTTRNLTLHPDAVINAKPELEIYTDDVKCSHGATIGQMSEDSLFYLRSRGLDEAQSRRMLCRAFIGECIGGPLAESAEHALLDGLRV